MTGGVRSPATRVSGAPEKRLSGLDGLRGLAILGVLVYHADFRAARGGFLGVDAFFVISGFLITYLLVTERSRAGVISLARFYARRARRLLPALFAMLAVLTGVLALFFPGDFREARGDIAAALGYFSNWWYVVHHRSYFVAIGRPPPLQHLWSLAVEEQFYLIWPLLLAVLCLGRPRPRLIATVGVAGAVASAWWMRTLAVAGNVPYDIDGSRLYFGTDTHASSLLLGAAAAGVVSAIRASSGARTSRWARRRHVLAELAASAALITVILAMCRVGEFTPSLYRGGFFAVGVVTAVLVSLVTRPASILGRVLDNPPLRWMGTRSYGLYIWHWPVFVYTRPGLDWPLHGLTAAAARIAITVALAEASYRIVELPIRTRGWRVVAASFTSRALAPIAAGAAVAAILLVPLAAYRVTVDTAAEHHAVAVPAAAPTVVWPTPQPTPTPIPAASPSDPTGTPSPSPAASSPVRSPIATRTAHASTPSNTAQPSGPPPQVTAVGDSILIDATPALRHLCPSIEIYAVIGWQAHTMFEELRALHDSGRLGAIVVIEAGTNGPVSPDELSATLTLLDDRSRVVLVNDHMDRPWEPANNALFPKAAASHSNTVVADWDTMANHHPEWLTPDGVHLQPAGVQPYAAMIQQAAGCG